MTEKPDWKKEIRQIIREELKTQKPTEESPPSSDEKHEHFHTDLAYLEADDSCPDCKNGLEQFAKDYMKKALLKRKDSPYVCEECGLGVEKNEEECPGCGSNNARER